MKRNRPTGAPAYGTPRNASTPPSWGESGTKHDEMLTESTLIKKEKKIYLIYKEIQSGAVAKSYMRKGFLINISPYMRRPLVIYDFATACSILNILMYEEILIFFFISLEVQITFNFIDKLKAFYYNIFLRPLYSSVPDLYVLDL
jgi:hypothetical protein